MDGYSLSVEKEDIERDTWIKTNISYDPDSGTFYNRHGRKVGSYTRRYGRIFIKGKEIKLSRLAIFITKGRWPELEVDHINNDKHDNRLCNLRECSRTENAQNKPKRSNNTTGYKGVFFKKDIKKFVAVIKSHNKSIYLGSFDDAKEAAYAYDNAAKTIHSDFANLNFNKE